MSYLRIKSGSGLGFIFKEHQTACLIFIGAVFLSFAFWAVASEEIEMQKDDSIQQIEEIDRGEEKNTAVVAEEKIRENINGLNNNINSNDAEKVENKKIEEVIRETLLEDQNIPKEITEKNKDDDFNDKQKVNNEDNKNGDGIRNKELKLRISEVMYYPEKADIVNNKTDRKYYQWIEIVNVDSNIKIGSNKKIDGNYILDFKICDRYYDNDNSKCKKSYPVYYKQEELNLNSNEIFIIARDKEVFESIYPNYKGNILESKFDLSSTLKPNFLGLFIEGDEKNSVINWIDKLSYYSDWGGKNENKTIERKNYEEENSKNNWEESVLPGGTPGIKYEKIETVYSKKIIINEILPNPIGDKEAGEWIEIYCFDEKGADLENWFLQDAGGIKYFLEKERIENGEFLIIERSKSAIALNNSGNETIYLKNPRGEIVSSLSYCGTHEGLSYAFDEDRKYQWTEILTPGEKNEFPEKKTYPRNILFNEIMSNPSGADKNNEWVELFNENDFEVDLQGWKIFNGQEKYFQIGKIGAPPNSLIVIEIKNSSFTIRNKEEALKLTDPNNEEIDRLEIVGVAKQGNSYNRSEGGQWNWSRFSTPGKSNRINNPPKIKIEIDNKIYKNIKAEFDASGSNDKDGDELKFRWDFGDGHYSYLEKTSHKYEKKGRYKVILRIDDGSVQVFKETEVKVNGFPEYNLKIMRLVPNPRGADTGKEEIEIKNNGLKDVDLKNWKIATGSEEEKMTGHPIYEETVIRAGQSIIIKNIDCHFSLPNKKGSVALIYPNGKEADRVVYTKDSVEENEEYILTEAGWFWFGQKISGSLSVLGDNTSNQMVKDADKRREVVFWQEIMSDKINLRTLNLRGLMIHNWLLREQRWKIFTVLAKSRFK
jgi:hypothetical protein